MLWSTDTKFPTIRHNKKVQDKMKIQNNLRQKELQKQIEIIILDTLLQNFINANISF